MSKILPVEDNETNRDMLSRRLLRRGYEVVIALDGESGLSLAESEAPDLILMDMSLPLLDGWEATTRLKAAPAAQHIPVIALTAHALCPATVIRPSKRAATYDTKPIELPRLLEKIEALLTAVGGGETS